MENKADQQDQDVTVWPPPIPHDIPPLMPLKKWEIFHARCRWFFTLTTPFYLILSILSYSEHDVKHAIMMGCDTLASSALAYRSWLLFERLRRYEDER